MICQVEEAARNSSRKRFLIGCCLNREERRFYTSLHGPMLESALREFFSESINTASVAMASFSAAQWIAPYGRISTQYLYAEESIVLNLTQAPRLSSPAKGDNVLVWIPST